MRIIFNWCHFHGKFFYKTKREKKERIISNAIPLDLSILGIESGYRPLHLVQQN